MLTIKTLKYGLPFVSMLMASQSYAALNMQQLDKNLGIPATYSQYQDILSKSKLQISAPEGRRSNKKEVAQDSNFTNIVNEYFYVDKATENFVFKMSGDHLRNELRIHDNFRTDLPDTFYRLNTSFLPIEPEASMANSDIKQNEITILQVHNKGTDNKGSNNVPHPLLRVVWKENAKGVKGHYWAIIKTNALICKGEKGKENINKPECSSSQAYKRYDLGAYSAGKAVNVDVIVGDRKMVIEVDGEVKVNHDITYWKPLLSFFKAGVYNQFSNGLSHVEFNKLEYVIETK